MFPEGYLSVAEAAEYLQLRVQTLYNYRYADKGPPAQTIMVGKRKRLAYEHTALVTYRTEIRSKQRGKGTKPVRRGRPRKPELEQVAA